MFAVIFRRRLRVLPNDSPIFVGRQFLAHQNEVFFRSFSSQKSSSDAQRVDPVQSSTVSYLINSCGLSSKDALSVSNKVSIKSPEKPDAVLQVLRNYGFTNAHIPTLVTRWPLVLVACPKKTLLPKLEFFRSIGVPPAVLARKISLYPMVLMRSLENYLIPSYNYFKSLVQSDEKVVNVFSRAPRAFAHGWRREISSSVAILRERGVTESSIVRLLVYQPSVLMIGKEKLAAYVDRAAAMGFDVSKTVFVHAIQVFADMSESTLKHKMDAYRRCGWSESDISAAFLRFPLCMEYSVKKIMANMDFLVNTVGCKPADVAQCPMILGLNLDKRIKPRCLISRILKAKGLLKKTISLVTLLKMSEEKFLKRYIVNFQKDIPQLLDIYQGKLSVLEMGFSQGEESK